MSADRRIQSPVDWYGRNVASMGNIEVRAERGSGDIALAGGANALRTSRWAWFCATGRVTAIVNIVFVDHS